MAGSNRIVGGNKATAPIPWQVSLQPMGWGDMHFCGGSIVDSKTIVTAAHCFMDEGQKWGVKVRAGTVDAHNGGQVVDVAKFVSYPKKMDPNTNEHDIMILKLATPLKFNDNVKPVCLATKDPKDGAKCYISGWGRVKSGM